MEPPELGTKEEARFRVQLHSIHLNTSASDKDQDKRGVVTEESRSQHSWGRDQGHPGGETGGERRFQSAGETLGRIHGWLQEKK